MKLEVLVNQAVRLRGEHTTEKKKITQNYTDDYAATTATMTKR